MKRICNVCGCEFEYEKEKRNKKQCLPCWRKHRNAEKKEWREKNYETFRKRATYMIRELRKKKADEFLPKHALYQKLFVAVSCKTNAIEKWIELCEHYGNKCLRCGAPGDYRSLTIDHVIPLSKGGPREFSNIQPLCKPCNSIKKNKTIDYRKE